MATRLLNLPQANVRAYVDAEELALKAAHYFARLADQYVIGDGLFTVALSGGSTPQAMFKLLAQEPFYSTVPWSEIHFFWADERCVPPDHADSNYRAAYELLLSKVPVKPENIQRFNSEDAEPARAAELYCLQLQKFFSAGLAANRTITAPIAAFPRFDLVLLGMGADGHTASLFPDTVALKAQDQIAVANYVPQLAARRLTLTVGSINNARNVTFLVSGKEKAETLRQVLTGPPRPDALPSQLIKPANGTLLWLVDEAAVSGMGRF
ncbi:MAG: 6-phosphogluconolactonase [Acidobacteria bacterium]|nr:6-phosphogluconolactonase [Acidobacteriota bacterium]MBI3423749.1 6-phosphogluconolactonase [Acidobacteriota bacterium]